MKRITLYTFLIIMLCIAFCSNGRFRRESELITKNLSLDQKIGLLMMVSVPGTSLTSDTQEILSRYRPGGVILFGYNIGTPSETKKFIGDMQAFSMKSNGLPIFVSIDQEGGRVKRIVEGVTQFPGTMSAGIAGEEDIVYRWGLLLGMQLRLLGVNMDLAPVLDVNNNPENPVINTRSFGSDPELVARLGVQFVRGLQEALCIAVGKHFPGHGDTNQDSHRTLPIIRYTLQRLRLLEFIPFIRAIEHGIDGIMTAHISYPLVLLNDDPATISPFFLTTLLRKEMGFRGLIVTDDMEMAAISKNISLGEGAVRAIVAGADIVLVSTYGKSIPEIFHSLKRATEEGRISKERIDDSVQRIIELKLKYKIAEYDKGTIRLGNVHYEAEELTMLKDAEALNKEISRKGILYCGDLHLITRKTGIMKVVVSSNPLIKQSLSKSDIPVFDHFEWASIRASLNDKTLPLVIFYHCEDTNCRAIGEIADSISKSDISLVIAASGNPFPIIQRYPAAHYLLSFSNTDESLRQLAYCIKGEFIPKTSSSLHLGKYCDGKK